MFHHGSRRRGKRFGALLTALLAGSLLLTGLSTVQRATPAPNHGQQLVALSTSQLTPATKWSVLYARTSRVPIYNSYGRVFTTLSNPNRYAEPLVFLGLGHMPGWWYVQLPIRPNGAKGWIKSAYVRLAGTTAYEIHLYRAAHRLDLVANRRLLYRTAIAVGAAAAPTPSGRYYITMLLRPANPYGPYGPWAFGLSAFSNVYTTFSNGTGEIGLHGTNQPSLLGQNVSHGCIRVSNTAITKLVNTVPVGAPVFIHA